MICSGRWEKTPSTGISAKSNTFTVQETNKPDIPMKFTGHFFFHKAFIALMMPVLFLTACSSDDDPPFIPPETGGAITIRFHHNVDSLPLMLDTLRYINNAGNLYKITDLQYFISDVTLYLHGGGSAEVAANDGIHYVDLRYGETMQWYPSDVIPFGEYDSVSFIFGINATKNLSNRFPDPPERDMFWPEMLGGGYHYMKLNVMWKDCCTNEINPFNMHLGIGQTYSSIIPDVDSITGFVQNYFRVSLPASSFTMNTGSTIFDITMNISKWFNGPPNLMNLAVLPAGIMQDQENMHKVCQNGATVFSIVIAK
jgi:hypothetical protein